MRGLDEQTGSLFSYVSCEERVPTDHPLRLIRTVVDEALDVLSPEFDRLYARVGRPSIAPEKLLRALLRAGILLGTVRAAADGADRLQLAVPLVRRLGDGCAGVGRDHLQQEPRPPAGRRRGPATAGGRGGAATGQRADVGRAFLGRRHADPGLGLAQVVPAQTGAEAGDPPAPSNAAACGPPPGRNAEQSWRGQKRSNETHCSITDPDARLARKSNGQASILAYAGHVLMENRNGLVAQSYLTHATGTAERDGALVLVDRLGKHRRITLGADKGYDVMGFVQALRQRRVVPHIATDRRVSKTGVVRRSGVDGRTQRHPGYAVSQRIRKRIEEVFGWMKSSAGFRQTKHRGRERVGWCFDLAAAAYNLIRLPKLLASA